MKRRDFLTFQPDGERQILVLSCQSLYMAYHDASTLQENETEVPANDGDWWLGEPPLSSTGQTTENLFSELDAELRKVDVLVLNDRQWIREGTFACFVERLLTRFRSSGGEIRYARTEPNIKPRVAL